MNLKKIACILILCVSNTAYSKTFHELFLNMQNFIKQKDSKSVSSLMEYPLVFESNNVKTQLLDAEDFMKNYELFFTPRLQTEILRCPPQSLKQKGKKYFLPNGSVWFAKGKKQTIKVRRIFK